MNVIIVALFATNLMLRMVAAFGWIFMASGAIPLSLLMATGSAGAIYKIISDAADVSNP